LEANGEDAARGYAIDGAIGVIVWLVVMAGGVPLVAWLVEASKTHELAFVPLGVLVVGGVAVLVTRWRAERRARRIRSPSARRS
jgi:Flp pilus assembly protein TadB